MNYKKIVYPCFSVIIILAQASCAAATQALPTQTAVVDTSTPLATSTPEATATSTATPPPTATSTPNVTATQIPEITPAAEGKGNVVGLVLWNNQPVAEAAVWLCQGFTYSGCNAYKTNTDGNGYYVFKNVTPGEYLVAINSFSSGWFIFYFDAEGTREQNVVSGENLILNPWSIWKFDLRVVSPRDGKAISEASPTFKWEAYPNAAYYQITIHDEKGNSVVENERVDGNEFTHVRPLVTCQYSWYVEAFNSEGMIIAHNAPPGIYTTNMGVNIFGVPGTCQ